LKKPGFSKKPGFFNPSKIEKYLASSSLTSFLLSRDRIDYKVIYNSCFRDAIGLDSANSDVAQKKVTK